MREREGGWDRGTQIGREKDKAERLIEGQKSNKRERDMSLRSASEVISGSLMGLNTELVYIV